MTDSLNPTTDMGNAGPAHVPQAAPIIELIDVGKRFGTVVALDGISIAVRPGEVHCLLGDNGAGKSTLIKILCGVHRPDRGEMRIDGKPVVFNSPRDAQERGIATVFQDLSLIPLMSIARNFFLGREPEIGRFVTRRFDMKKADAIVDAALKHIGIHIQDPQQAVGTLSGGQRQCVAIARAVHFGARVLILDEPTSALGVHQAGMVLRIVAHARDQGIGIVFITHNIHHAFPIADTFTLLNRGRSLGCFAKGAVTEGHILEMMSGGRDLDRIAGEVSRRGAAS
jgi:simple sugar transport system ATP-binding protein